MLFLREVRQLKHFLPLHQKNTVAPVFGNVFCQFNGKEVTSGRYFCVKPHEDRKATVDNEEVEKFQRIAEDWWSSKFALLHEMNHVRVPFVRDGILSRHSPRSEKAASPLGGFTMLDVGCGGGLLAEALARIGAQVTGLDPGAINIKIAQNHAELDSTLKGNLDYRCGTIEELSMEDKKYDALVCSEVIEHVDNVDFFVKCCTDVVKDGGSLFFTTINRTTSSYIIAILLAEYITGIIPRGTHEWKKFIRPDDLKHMLQSRGCRTLTVHGIQYNPFFKKWSFSRSSSAFYFLHAVKENVPKSTASV